MLYLPVVFELVAAPFLWLEAKMGPGGSPNQMMVHVAMRQNGDRGERKGPTNITREDAKNKPTN